MGGRVALHLALAHPERIRGLVLESASAGIRVEEERCARVQSDAELADLLEREGTAAFVDRWERLPLFDSQRRLPPDVRSRLRCQRLSSSPIGLANSLRGLGAGTQKPLHDRLGSIAAPALIVSGSLDDRYCNIGRDMAAAMPRAVRRVIPDAGHAVHLEQPILFTRYVLEFLNQPCGHG
jgi:2-succinyl-6-hydroxy-2,4-cyclohexadiene-1-carboxylate synthase